MVSTILADTEKLKYFYENRDCLNWQPLSLITSEIKEYIESPRSEAVRLERFSAYLTLFTAARFLFGVKILEIERSEHGKPYIKAFELTKGSDEGRKGFYQTEERCAETGKDCLGKGLGISKESGLFFSISHSGRLCAVALSDEGEVGVDIQIKPEKAAAERLNKKYFEGLAFSPKEQRTGFFEADFSESGLCLSPIANAENVAPCTSDTITLISCSDKNEGEKSEYEEEFLKNWTVSEALLKCDGRGFSAKDTLPSLCASLDYDCYYINKNGNIYGLSTAKARMM